MTFPNFLVIGAAKSGTDSLCSRLSDHPEIFMSPNKEPMFFVAEGRPQIPYTGPGDRDVLADLDMWIWSRDRYERLFDGVTGEKAIGEGSTWYLYDEGAPSRIHSHAPRMKLIALLRNPVDRAYSAFTMLLRDGRETTTDFVRALEAEDKRVRLGWEPMWHYRRMGFYQQQLRRYHETFAPEQVHVVLQDDFAVRPNEVLRNVFSFLGVDDGFHSRESPRLNVSLVPEHATYHRLVSGHSSLKAAGKALLPAGARQRIRSMLPASPMKKPEPMPAEARAILIDRFREDILALQDMLNRDLSSWLR